MAVSISKKNEKEKFNEFIRNCEESAYHMNMDKDITKSFPVFILHLYFNLDNQTIKDSIRGLGSNDDGLDAFFINEEKKEIHLVQFKSRKNFNEQNNEFAKKEWFILLDTFKDRITSTNFKTNNKRIEEIRDLLITDYLDFQIHKHLFHLGEISDNNLHNYPEIEYYSQKDILEKFVRYVEANSDSTPDEITLTIEPQQSQNFSSQNNFILFTPKPRDGKTRKTFVFPLNGQQVIHLLEKEGTTILERNVRGYLGEKNAVNKGIIKTALEKPEHFYFFNNGISITCEKLDVQGLQKNNPTIKITHPQIINGAQTVNSLQAAYQAKKKELLQKKSSNIEEEALNHMKNIHILCKIMESTKHMQANFAKEVTEYSNTQNKIKQTDFYANRPEQKTIQEEMERYSIQYIIKRGKNYDDKKGAKYSVNMETLGETHWAQIDDPFQSKATSIFKDDCENEQESIYFRVFGNNGSHNAARTLELAKSFFIYHFVDKYIDDVKKTYEDLRDWEGKNFEDFKNEKKDFLKVTKASKHCRDIIDKKTDPHMDKISEYIFLMDFKIVCYITRELIKELDFENNDEERKSIDSILKEALEKNKFEKIEDIIKSVLHESLSCYGNSIHEMFRDKKIIKRHPKTKETKRIIDNEISKKSLDAIKFDY